MHRCLWFPAQAPALLRSQNNELLLLIIIIPFIAAWFIRNGKRGAYAWPEHRVWQVPSWAVILGSSRGFLWVLSLR
jgi:hypothetical protein